MLLWRKYLNDNSFSVVKIDEDTMNEKDLFGMERNLGSELISGLTISPSIIK